MRIAIAGLWHETNTFSSVPADLAAFEAEALLRGADIFDEYRDSGATVAGFLDAARRCGFEPIPLVHARTGPIGLITAEAFEAILDEIVDGLRAGGPWDAVLLANHGAAASAAYRDADTEIARRVREAVGPSVPIGVALDLHANLSVSLLRYASVITVYQTNPHLDARERGDLCAWLTWRTARGEIRPVMWLETPPLAINIVRQATEASPMREVLEAARRAERTPGVLGTSAVQGYPYADVEEMGMSFLALTDGNARLARQVGLDMAAAAWALRDQMRADLPSLDETLLAAGVASSGPVVIMDVGDNVLGGSSADSTIILAAARRLRIRGILQSLYDPNAVRACAEAGTGRWLSLEVGGRTDRAHGEPLPVHGQVKHLDEGRYEDPGPTHGGFRYFDDGPRAVFATDEGNTLLLISRRNGSLSRQQFYSAGLRPEDFPMVVAKGVVSPRPAYEPIASQILLADTPGLTTAALATFDYQYRRRPLYPFEADAVYGPPDNSAAGA